MKAILLLATLVLIAQTEVEITNEPHHHLSLENEYVRVFDVEVPAHTDTLMHIHHHDYVFVTIGASDVINEEKGKPPVTLHLQDGETRLLSAPLTHIAHNQTDRPFINSTIELLYPTRVAKECATKNCVVKPANWDDTRGVSVLPAGTKQILFANQGVRASEIELQPAGSVTLTHAGPCLLVAVGDVDLRSEAKGDRVAAPPASDHVGSGKSKWLSGYHARMLTNSSQHPAKFVVLEFP